MEFVINRPEFYLVTACCDMDHNASLGYYSSTLSICQGGEHMPGIPGELKCFPRLLVRNNSGVYEGKYIHISIECEIVVVMKVTTLAQVQRYLMKICTVCDFPHEQCICNSRCLPPFRVWTLMFKGEEVSTNERFQQILRSPRNIVMYADLDFVDQRDCTGNVDPEVTMELQSGREVLETITSREVAEPIVQIVEDIGCLLYQLRRSRDWLDVTVAIGACVRSMTDQPNVYFLKDLLALAKDELEGYFSLQAGGDWIDTLDNFYTNFAHSKDSNLVKKLTKVFNHLIAHCVYFKMGVKIDSKLFALMEKDMLRPSMFECLSFADAVADLIIFLLKRGRQCMISGSLEPMFINETSTSKWMLEVRELKMQSEFLGNPDAIKLSLFEYLNRVHICLEEGKSLVKFLQTTTPEWRAITSLMSDLTAVYYRYLSVTCAQSLRRQPLGVVLFGDPGVGKSAVANMICHFDDLRRGRPTGAGYRYQFPSDSDFLDNFKSYMHTIIMDDVAQHAPNKVQGVDPSVSTMIKIFNNQPYCPPQAALEDKGKTPMLVDLGIVTTNKLDMNLSIYFEASYAPMRRLRIHVQPVVKPEFRREGSSDMDPTKAVSDEMYPDYWDFVIRQPAKKEGSMAGVYEEVCTFHSTKEFLEWFGMQSDQHHREQVAFLKRQTDLGGELMCEECKMPTGMCECSETISSEGSLQGGRFSSPTDEWLWDEEDTPDLMEENDEDTSLFDLFDEEKSRWQRNWRPKVHSGTPRVYTQMMSYRFARKWAQQPSMTAFANYYAFAELPVLMNLGWTNKEIASDFKKFVHSRRAKKEQDQLDLMVALLYENEAEHAVTEEVTWNDTFFKWFVSLYFHWSFFAWWVRMVAWVPLSRRLFVWWYSATMRKNHIRDFFARKVGRVIDCKLGGANPKIHLFLSAAKVLAAVGIVGILVKYMSSSISAGNPKPKTYYRADVNGYYWEYDESGRQLRAWIVDGKHVRMLPNGEKKSITRQSDKYGYLWEFRDGMQTGVPILDRNGVQVVTVERNLPVKIERKFNKDNQLAMFVNDVETELVLFNGVPVESCDAVIAPYDEEVALDAVDEDECLCNPTLMLPRGQTQCDRCVEARNVDLQSLRRRGIVPQPMPGDEKSNVWAQKERVVTTADYLPGRCIQLDAFEKKLVKNVLCFEMTTYEMEAGERRKVRYTGQLLALNAETFLTNNHSLPLGCDLHFRVFWSKAHGQACPYVEMLIKQTQVRRIPNRDIAVVKTMALPNLFTDISQNLVRSSFEGHFDGYYLVKQSDGSVIKKHVFNAHTRKFMSVMNENQFNMTVYEAIVRPGEETVKGDCGSPLVLITPLGPIVVGFHSIFLSGLNTVLSSRFIYEDFEMFAAPMKVQVGCIQVTPDTIELGDISYVDFHNTGSIMYHGELKGFRSRPKHHVRDTEIKSQLIGRTVAGFSIEDKFTGPWMDSWRPQQVSLKEFIHPIPEMDEPLLKECADVFFDHLVVSLPDDEWLLMHPYPLDVAVNGVPGMAFVDSIKKSTSMGYPWKTTKRNFLVPLDDDRWPDGVKFTPEIEKEIAAWLNIMESGYRAHGVFSANLKDEPVKYKKYLIKKTRVFFSGPVPLLVIIRMYFMGFCRVVSRNPYCFFSAVGLNAHSSQWEELYKFLSKHGTERCVAGDYAFFDKKIKVLMLKVALKLIIRICTRAGLYSEQDKVVMEAIMHDLCNPTVDYFGMLITLLGGEVSGHQITTLLNCVVNVLYLMYSYGKTGYDVRTFFDEVTAIVLGDDHVLCCTENVPKFNHTAIQKVMLEMGVDYTMADKESESVPYISLHDAIFLKRSFTYSTYLGCYVGPLDVESIFKMITVQVASKAVQPSEQLAQAICSANMEAFFHGKQFFNEFEELIQSLEVSESLEIQMKKYPRLTWGQNVQRFRSADVLCAALVESRNQDDPVKPSDCTSQVYTLQSLVRVEDDGILARAFPESRFYGCVEQDTKQSDTGSWTELSFSPDNQQLAKETSESETQLNVPETQGSVDVVQEQTTFANESVPEKLTIDQAMNPNADSQLISSTLGNYMSRPTKILTYTWSENAPGGVQNTFYPWRLFFTHPYISNKLQSFGLIRCKLHVKLTVNASQFYYGSIGAFYQPRKPSIDNINWSKSTSGGQILISQRPHVWLNPQSVSSAEMELPFLVNTNWLSTYNAQALENMGTMDLVQFAALRSANGVTTTGVNIVVYAWATDVEVTGPTYNAILQSKKEYLPSGQISGPASTIANVASRLTDIPVIGPFAKATEMVSGTVGSLAAFFGFTNVPNVRDVEPVKSVAFHTLASSQISEPINKLSLQPKQETTLFSKYEAQSEDPLHIASLVGRESFLCGSLWSTTDTENTVLFTSSVRPDLFSFVQETNQAVIFETPMSYVSRMFGFWTGDIIFRFKVIKTQYHRGRLNLTWDSQAVNAQFLPGYGHPSVMNIVFDLDETDEIEVRVPYMQALPYLAVVNLSSSNPQTNWSNGPSPAFNTTTGNGMLQVRVINRLTAPEASSDVDLLVFVRGAENLSFASPIDLNSSFYHYEVQSKKEYIFDGTPSNGDNDFAQEMFGEKIVSLRELMHRQSQCLSLNPTFTATTSSEAVLRVTLERTPPTPGYHSDGWFTFKSLITPVNTAKYMPSRMIPVTWMMPCFLGNKGSMNYSFNVRNQANTMSDNATRVEAIRADSAASLGMVTLYIDKDSANSQSVHTGLYRVLPGTSRGSALTSQTTQAGLSVNVPYYWNTRFQYNNIWVQYKTSNLTTSGVTLLASKPIGTYDAGMVVDIYSGTGPDFDLLFFINVPTVYAYVGTPLGA